MAADTDRLAYIMLHVSPDCGLTGCIEYDDRTLRTERPEKSLSEMVRVGLIEREDDLIRITQFLRFSPIGSWKHAVAAVSEMAHLPVCGMTRSIAHELAAQPGYRQMVSAPESLSKGARQNLDLFVSRFDPDPVVVAIVNETTIKSTTKGRFRGPKKETIKAAERLAKSRT